MENKQTQELFLAPGVLHAYYSMDWVRRKIEARMVSDEDRRKEWETVRLTNEAGWTRWWFTSDAHLPLARSLGIESQEGGSLCEEDGGVPKSADQALGFLEGYQVEREEPDKCQPSGGKDARTESAQRAGVMRNSVSERQRVIVPTNVILFGFDSQNDRPISPSSG